MYVGLVLTIKVQKHLNEFDNTSSDNADLAEISRPRRQFKEDEKKKNKPAGRKRMNDQQKAQRMNWHQPFIWSDIEEATRRAGKPWQPRAIMKEAKRINSKTFETLTEQVVGRWIDRDAYDKSGAWKWRDAVLEEVARGNAPGGQSTRSGILVSRLTVNYNPCYVFLIQSRRNHILKPERR